MATHTIDPGGVTNPRLPLKGEKLGDYLERILPEILSEHTPMIGSDIIKLLEGAEGFRWGGETVRYYLSTMAKDPSGPVMKPPEQGGISKQGYLLRPRPLRHWSSSAQRAAREALREARLLLIALRADANDAPRYWETLSEASRNLDTHLEAFDREVADVG